MHACTVCGSPAADAFLCNNCLGVLAAELRQIPWLVKQLDITLTRQARVGERSGPRSSETPLPYHVNASIDLETLRDGLGMWATAVAEQRGIEVDEERRAEPLARWLLRWQGAVAQHPDAGELHGDILAMTKSARRTIDLAPDRRFLGPCDDCGEDLYVWARPGHLPNLVHCGNDECDFSAPVESRRVWLLEQAYDRLLTAAEMSRAIRELVPGQSKPISANLISQWASRGLRGQRLTPYLPHPRDPHNRTRYRVEEVLTFARLAMDTKDERPQSA